MKSLGSTVLAIILVALLALIMTSGAPSCQSWLSSEEDTSADVTTPAPTTPEQASRNAIWTMFNSRCEPPESAASELLTPFDRSLCLALHPQVTDEIRVSALEQLKFDDAIRYEPGQLPHLISVLRDESVDIKIGLMRGLAADSEGGMRIRSIVVDRTRLRLFLWGETVPLE